MTLPQDEMSALAREVTALLGAGWQYVYDTNPRSLNYSRQMFELHGPDGARILVNSGAYDSRGRLNISARYPDTDLYRVKGVSITVAETRGASVVAKEITRRVLPDYLPELARVNEHNVMRAAKTSNRRTVAAELASMMPREGRVADDERNVETRVTGTDDESYIDIRLNADGSAGHVEISSLPTDQIRALLALLADKDDDR